MGVPMRHTAGQLRYLGNKNLILLTPIDDNFVLFHLQIPSHLISQNDRPDLSHLIRLGFTIIPLQVYCSKFPFIGLGVYSNSEPTSKLFNIFLARGVLISECLGMASTIPVLGLIGRCQERCRIFAI